MVKGKVLDGMVRRKVLGGVNGVGAGKVSRFGAGGVGNLGGVRRKVLVNHKIYKLQENYAISNLRIVSMTPDDRKVVGCFNFSGGYF